MTWLLVLLVLLNLGLFFVLFRKKGDKNDQQSLNLMMARLDSLSQTLDQKLGEGNRSMTDFLHKNSAQTQSLMSEITKQVSGQLLEVVKGVSETKESTKQVFTIAEQLRNLERVLKNQKQRGNLGESSLELILSNVLPGQYESQYMFEDGEKVDFIIKTPEGLVPIDAKFPLENYVRLTDEIDEEKQEIYRKDFKNDVKKRIDETSKYIREGEGTMPFAIMFIPAEGIYYDILNGDVGTGINSRDLMTYAYQQKNVIIASPTTFLAYLQTILLGNKRAKIQEDAKNIMKNVAELSKHLNSYEEAHNSLGKSLNTAVGHYDKASRAFKQIDKDVIKIGGDSIGIEPLTLERPGLE